MSLIFDDSHVDITDYVTDLTGLDPDSLARAEVRAWFARAALIVAALACGAVALVSWIGALKP